MTVGDQAREECGALYAEHHRWLLGWLRQRLGCLHDAADLAQDTFIRVLTARDAVSVEPIHEPRAFLRTVAGRLLSNHLRRRSLELAWQQTLANLPEPEVPSPEVQAVLLQTLHEIDALLDGLPARARRVFLLAQLEGLTYAQIAEQFGVSVRTIKRDMAEAFEQCILLTP
ncbi:RNA polymerase subunit sigma [Halopseudomonas pachastrellae]|uniref:RNA polymerase subunit sigma n=1 Tax=Halopseudomonas pachastrellae TaxID=254161 RepID=A0A1S8DI03_9GAMM|nr:sigma-70 family RNA polymerase sigma factor [Halopseudomonas pachastrellae]ONM44489.1 RNA polymerase subunit sigma [Halopseudomonas pachastrellae]SFM83631.1 RNA polymerase sigma-70 factor, ECF subfamily [Halopseudomonas pachastrellae]